MIIIDIILLIIILGAFIYGWRTGLIKAIGSLIGLVVGIILASRYFELVADWFLPLFKQNENLAKIAGFLAIFLAANIIIGILVTMLQGIFKIIPFLTTINRLAGAVIAIVAAIFSLGFLIIMIDKFPFNEFITRYFENSQIVPRLKAVAEFLTPFIPEALNEIKGVLK